MLAAIDNFAALREQWEQLQFRGGDEHAYYLNGLRLPSVTQVIEDFGGGPIYPPGPYKVRGDRVHHACELFDLGEDLNDYEIGEEIWPRVNAYVSMMNDMRFEWSLIEQRMYDPHLMIAGKADRVGFTASGEPVVLDLKTGKPGREVALQTAGYTRMAFPKDYEQVKRYKAELHEDGTYRLSLYADFYDFEAWKAYVSVYKWKRRK